MISLENLCLDSIVQNMEQFYSAFTLSKDKNLKRNFEYLQRRFSLRLLVALHMEENLKDEYFELLIHEHLHFLNGNWFNNSRYLNSMDNIFCRLPNLTKIYFKRCSDEILKVLIQFCPKLVEINIQNSKVTDDGIKYLCKKKNGIIPCPELKYLFITPSCVTREGVTFLIQNIPSLERIDYPEVPFLLHSICNKNSFKFVKFDNCNLTELDLYGCRYLPNYTNILKTCLTVIPKLQSLRCHITGDNELNFFTNAGLKKLDLIVTDRNLKVDNFLNRNGKSLTYLKIYCCTISASLLMLNCPILKVFHANIVTFQHNTTDADGCQAISPSLTECHFSFATGCAVEALNVLITHSPKLESLKLSYCELSVEMKDEILIWCRNPSAKEIFFDKCNLELEFLKEILLNCPSLKAMYLNRNEFDVLQPEGLLNDIADKLPNKPYVFITNQFCTDGMNMLKRNIFIENILDAHGRTEIHYKLKKGYDAYFNDVAADVEKEFLFEEPTFKLF